MRLGFHGLGDMRKTEDAVSTQSEAPPRWHGRTGADPAVWLKPRYTWSVGTGGFELLETRLQVTLSIRLDDATAWCSNNRYIEAQKILRQKQNVSHENVARCPSHRV